MSVAISECILILVRMWRVFAGLVTCAIILLFLPPVKPSVCRACAVYISELLYPYCFMFVVMAFGVTMNKASMFFNENLHHFYLIFRFVRGEFHCCNRC